MTCARRREAAAHCAVRMEPSLRLAPQPELKRVLCKKAGKSTSGVLVITVLTSPYPTERTHAA